MIRALIASPLLFVFLAGCTQSYQPAKREPAEPQEPAEAPPSEAVAESGHPQVPGVEFVEGGREVQAGAVRLTAPETWVRQPPRSGFVAAEFQLPRAEGDERDGRLTVSVAGGSVQANVDRWRGQFGEAPEKETTDEVPIAGVTVTVVDFTGTFNDQMGPFAPAEKREGYRMMGAVIPAGGQLHFVKAYGPQNTIEQQAAAFRAFLQTLRVDAPSS